jgi:hypothetical protein
MGQSSYLSIGVVLSICTTDAERSSPTNYTSVDAVKAKNVPFGSLINIFQAMGRNPPDTTNFGDGIEISILNVYPRISALKKRIITLDTSLCKFRQGTRCAVRKSREWGHTRGQIYKRLFSKGKSQPTSKRNRICCVIFQPYKMDEKFQRTTYAKLMLQNRLVKSDLVCGVI